MMRLDISFTFQRLPVIIIRYITVAIKALNISGQRSVEKALKLGEPCVIFAVNPNLRNQEILP
jgi:hypothetical protein